MLESVLFWISGLFRPVDRSSRVDFDSLSTQWESLSARVKDQLIRELKQEIEERKAIEGQLESAQAELLKSNAELQKKNREVEQFVYAASHDLKSPLFIIEGFAGYLREDLHEGKYDCFDEYITHVGQAVSTMKRLIDDLLDLSRVGKVSPRTVEPLPILRKLADLHHDQLAKRGVTLQIPQEMPSIVADPDKTERVFDNLLVNAIHHGSDGEKPCITIGYEQRDGELLFFVRDNGQGIDARYHRKIFEVFERLDSKIEGTGMGLTIVERLVGAHGGRIWVESSPGQGATFWFTLS